MDIERDTVVEAVAASVPPALAIAALYVVGQSYSDAEGLTPTGAQAIVAVVVGFILLTTVVGLYRARST